MRLNQISVLIFLFALGAYFVVEKTRHDGAIARDTERIAKALEKLNAVQR